MTVNKEIKAGLIGFGNMASAIVQGWKRMDVLPAENIAASAARYERLLTRAQALGICAMKTNREVCEFADVVILAVKPNLIAGVVKECADVLKNKIIVSIAAGITNEDLEAMLPGSAHLAVMPNLPISTGQGIVLFAAGFTLDSAQEQIVRDLFDPVALVMTVPADKFSIAGTIAGCAPAYAAMFAEALADAGVYYGLARSEAYELAAKVIEGTGAMILTERISPAALKDAVCSPKGTTIKGVYALEKDGFRGSVMDAISAVESAKVQK